MHKIKWFTLLHTQMSSRNWTTLYQVFECHFSKQRCERSRTYCVEEKLLELFVLIENARF